MSAIMKCTVGGDKVALVGAPVEVANYCQALVVVPVEVYAIALPFTLLLAYFQAMAFRSIAIGACL